MKSCKCLRTSLFYALFFHLAIHPAMAQGVSRAGDSGPRAPSKPIEINDSTLGGLRYFYDGEPLDGYRELEDLVYPLRDYEAGRLLKRSETSDRNAKIFQGIGWAGLVTGLVGLLTAPSRQQTGFWITAVGGGVLIDIGGLFGSEAQTSKFNCVQRYNRFARGEEQVLPVMPKDEKSLLDFQKKP